MESYRFGFGDSSTPAYKFDPTDADLVAHYLLPRALNFPDPYQGVIIDDDTMSLPPQELLRKHGHGGSDHAFFFEPPADRTQNGARRERTVKGGAGMWRGQKREPGKLTLMLPGGGELDLAYKRYCLTFYRAGEENKIKTAGWVMYEYEITSPPLPGTVLTRIKMTNKGKKDMQEQLLQQAEAAAADNQVFPAPPQPGPCCHHAVMADEEGFQVQEATYNPAVMTSAGEGEFSGGENDALHDGGMPQMGYHYADPLHAEQGAVYYGDYCQYHEQEGLPCPDQQQLHHAGDATAMCECGEGVDEEASGGNVDDNGTMGCYQGDPLFNNIYYNLLHDVLEYGHGDDNNGDQLDPHTGCAAAAVIVMGAGEGVSNMGKTGGPLPRSFDPFDVGDEENEYDDGSPVTRGGTRP